MPIWILIIGIGFIAYFLWRSQLPRKPQLNNGGIPISPEVNSNEFSSLLAEALLNKQARPLLPTAFQSGNGCITWREIMFMKFILGKIDKDAMIEEIEAHKNDSYQDAEVLNWQVKTLASKLKT